MKVAIDVTAVPARPAGAGRYVVRLVETLADLAVVELVLVTRRGDGTRWSTLAPRAAVVPSSPGPRVARLAWEQTVAPLLARRLGVDLWHGPHYTMPLARRGPTVVTIHDLTMFDHPEWHESAKARFFPAMIRQAVRRADALVCVSHPTAERLRELLDPQVPVVVAPLGVDTNQFRADAPEAEDRALLEPLGVGTRFVAAVGTIEPRKNLPTLVRAVAALPDLQLVLAGQEGWGVEEVDRAVADAGIADRVVRLGYVTDEEVAALYRRASAVAYVPFEEGFGLPALEALACRAALVTSAGTVMGTVTAGAALLVDPRDSGAVRAALARLVEGGDAVTAMRAAGPGVAAGHSWTASAERHVEAYRLAVTSRR